MLLSGSVVFLPVLDTYRIVTIAILGDSHLTDRDDTLPESFVTKIRDADHVIHTGDFESRSALETIEDLATDLTAVYGNADPTDIDLPAVASVAVGGVTFVVVHGIVNPVERATGSSEGVVMNREDWLSAVADTARTRTDEPRIGIGGHTHQVEDVVVDGVRVLNPGSATGVAPAEHPTMMTATVEDEEVDVTLHNG